VAVVPSWFPRRERYTCEIVESLPLSHGYVQDVRELPTYSSSFLAPLSLTLCETGIPSVSFFTDNS